MTFAKIATVDFFAFKKIVLACFGQKIARRRAVEILRLEQIALGGWDSGQTFDSQGFEPSLETSKHPTVIPYSKENNVSVVPISKSSRHNRKG